MKIDLSGMSRLTLGEAEDFEAYARTPVTKLYGLLDAWEKGGKAGAPPVEMPVLVGLVWVLGRRQDPQLTPEDVRGLSFDEIEWVGTDGRPGKAVEVGTAGSGRARRAAR